jgi:hypothetical protein
LTILRSCLDISSLVTSRERQHLSIERTSAVVVSTGGERKRTHYSEKKKELLGETNFDRSTSDGSGPGGPEKAVWGKSNISNSPQTKTKLGAKQMTLVGDQLWLQRVSHAVSSRQNLKGYSLILNCHRVECTNWESSKQLRSKGK